MKNCLFFLSARTGVVLIAMIFCSLSVSAFLVNVPFIIKEKGASIIVLLVWIFGLLFIGIMAFLAVYNDRIDLLACSTTGLLFLLIFWFIVSVTSIYGVSHESRKYLCLHWRCGESLWLMSLPWRIKNITKEHISCCIRTNKSLRKKYFGTEEEWKLQKEFLESKPCNLQISDKNSSNFAKDNTTNLTIHKAFTASEPKNEMHRLIENQSALILKLGDAVSNNTNTLWTKEKLLKIGKSYYMETHNNGSYKEIDKPINQTGCDDVLYLDEYKSFDMNDNFTKEYIVNRLYNKVNGIFIFPEKRILKGTKATSISMLVINICFFLYSWIIFFSYWRTLGKTMIIEVV